MSSIEHTATPPERPITARLASERAGSGLHGASVGPGGSVAPGAGAALLGQVRDTLAALRAAPQVLHQLGEDDLTDLGRAAIELTRAGESLAVEVTTEALTRGTIAHSTAASATHWVRGLGSGVEPGQAYRIATVAAELATSATLTPLVPPTDSGDPDGTITGDATAGDNDEGDNDASDNDGGDGLGAGSALVAGDPSGRALIGEVVRSGLVNIRAVAHALKDAPRLQGLIPTATRAETLSWFLALGDEATDKDRRALTRRLIARFEPGDLDRSEATAQARESLTFQHLPNGLVRLVAELSPGNAAIVQQAISHLAAPRPTPCTDQAGDPPPTSDARPSSDKQRDAVPPGAPIRRARREDTTGPDDAGDATGTTGTDVAGDPSGARGERGADQQTAFVLEPEDTSLVRTPRQAVGAGAKLYDDRTPGKRRADALMELINHATDRLPRPGRGSITGSSKAVVVLDLATLQADTDPPHVRSPRTLRPPGTVAPPRPPGTGAPPRPTGILPGTGRTLTGDLLAPSTLRTLACNAGIIPAVLDSNSQLLDLGREERLFTGHLRTAIVLRDQHCTFPGCDRPPDWCDVHHLIPWWAGGPTNESNGALLCGRHHTIVHTHLLLAILIDGRVQWDLTPGRMPQRPRLDNTA